MKKPHMAIVDDDSAFAGYLRTFRSLRHYETHYHAERNHQGKDNVLLFPLAIPAVRGNKVRRRERLGGLLKYKRSS